jgi:hypothetical protein
MLGAGDRYGVIEVPTDSEGAFYGSDILDLENWLDHVRRPAM